METRRDNLIIYERISITTVITNFIHSHSHCNEICSQICRWNEMYQISHKWAQSAVEQRSRFKRSALHCILIEFCSNRNHSPCIFIQMWLQPVKLLKKSSRQIAPLKCCTYALFVILFQLATYLHIPSNSGIISSLLFSILDCSKSMAWKCGSVAVSGLLLRIITE